jgi:hypothetical protein
MPVPEALSPEAAALRQARQQRAEAWRKLKGAETNFDTAKAATEQKRLSALAQAAKSSGHAEWAKTYSGLLDGMANKIRVDSDVALAQLGLPPVQPRSTLHGQKDSLQREFQVYRDGLTESGPAQADGLRRPGTHKLGRVHQPRRDHGMPRVPEAPSGRPAQPRSQPQGCRGDGRVGIGGRQEGAADRGVGLRRQESPGTSQEGPRRRGQACAPAAGVAGGQPQ